MVRLEISAPEHGADEPEYLDAIGLQDFKLKGPRSIACLPLRFQIAQKLHAVSERPVERPNDRFRDLVDLLVLRDLIDDLPALRHACETTFESRATHSGLCRSTRRRSGRPATNAWPTRSAWTSSRSTSPWRRSAHSSPRSLRRSSSSCPEVRRGHAGFACARLRGATRCPP
jgi:hypothetical protein